jgi:hypothetical protein
MSDTGYDVFISYSAKEIEFVTRLTSALRSNGCTTFGYLDVPVGEDWRIATNEALTESRFILVVLSQAYCASRVVEDEWRIALQRENEESRVVILPAWLEDCDVPAPLSDKVRVDFRGSEEPDIFNAE